MSEPEVFGQYHLLEKIASGGMAEVFRARSYGIDGFEKIIVIKRILDHLGKDNEFITLFIDEARITVSLHHVNIVQVFELGKENGSYYMAMEYVHGIDLARLVNRARKRAQFPIALACFVVIECLKALQFAHQRTDEDGNPLHVVHCDISPQNILISFAGEVKITDFGISRASFQAQDQQDVVRGKYAYMSPEQVEGKPLDGRSDLFSLGIVFYELLTGRRLFKARSRDETLARVKRAEVPSARSCRPEISEDLEDFLIRALARYPEQRFQDADDMLEALSAIMVREGHRVTNHDLSAFLASMSEPEAPMVPGQIEAPPPRKAAPRSPRTLPPSAVVVLAVEAAPPPRNNPAPRPSIATLTQEWMGIVADRDAEIWESGEGSLLAVWVARGGLRESVARAVRTALDLQAVTLRDGYRLAAGIAPGVVRLNPDTRRPSDGWELAGPFYLARWMMNLSAHRGRVLLTEVGRKQLDRKAALLGRIPIHGNRYINLYELA